MFIHPIMAVEDLASVGRISFASKTNQEGNVTTFLDVEGKKRRQKMSKATKLNRKGALDRARTDDLRLIRATRYQLRYESCAQMFKKEKNLYMFCQEKMAASHHLFYPVLGANCFAVTSIGQQIMAHSRR